MSASAHCRVVGGEKLTAESGGSSALCVAVEKAIRASAPRTRYDAEVRVLSPSRLSATLIVEGRRLPEQKLAIMDRTITAAAVERFAQALAAEVAKAAK